jgi:hypothetical protein
LTPASVAAAFTPIFSKGCMFDTIGPSKRPLLRGQGRDRWHALVWALGIGIPLWIAPIGAVSGDGLVQSIAYSTGTWGWNPNHLLLEPLGAGWLGCVRLLLGERSAPDLLKLLSVTSGALAAGLFRWTVGPVVAGGMTSRNLATAWFVLSAGFLAHLLSDETHMIQMPWLVLMSSAALRLASHARWPMAVGFGVAGGLATLSFASNFLVLAALGAALMIRWAGEGSLRRSLGNLSGVTGGITATLVFGLWLAWTHVSPGMSWIDWILSYGGGATSRAAAEYGIEWSLAGIAVAGARMAFGAASAVVDQTPGVLTLRGIERQPLEAGVAVVVLSLAVWFLGTAVRGLWRSCGLGRDRLNLIAAWALGVLAFALYWSNSDGQFYFQLAVPVGIVAGVAADRLSRPVVIATSLVVLGWNASAAARTQIFYPRQAHVASLAEATADAAVVLIPGWDEIEQMLFFVPQRGEQRLSVMSLADRLSPTEGLARLDSVVATTLNRGGVVAAIGIVGANMAANPWRFLATLGYDQRAVERTLVEGRQVRVSQSGAFSVARITAP